MKKSLGWHVAKGFTSSSSRIKKLAYLCRYRQFGDQQDFFKRYGCSPSTESRTLDLGCGTNLRNPFGADESFGIDIREHVSNNIRAADLTTEPIPFESNFFDRVTAYDFLEHVPRVIYLPERRFPFIEVMNEVYRVLKPEGLFLSVTPAYPFGAAFKDPTHVNIITDETFPTYFDNVQRVGRIYGFNGAFLVVKQAWDGEHLITVLKKVPVPPLDE